MRIEPDPTSKLFEVKFVSGDNVIGYVELDEDENHIYIIDPVLFTLQPGYGYSMTDWLILSENNFAKIEMEHVIFFEFASSTGIKLYKSALKRWESKSDKPVVLDDTDEIAEMMEHLMKESSKSIKH